MGPIDFTTEERRLVTRILDEAFQSLRSEIYKTEDSGMKDELKREEKVLAAILERFGIHKQLVA